MSGEHATAPQIRLIRPDPASALARQPEAAEAAGELLEVDIGMHRNALSATRLEQPEHLGTDYDSLRVPLALRESAEALRDVDIGQLLNDLAQQL